VLKEKATSIYIYKQPPKLCLGFTPQVEISMYKKCVPMYIHVAEIKRLETTQSKSYKHLLEEEFEVRRTQNYNFNSVATDQELQQTGNRDGKSRGGVNGLTWRKTDLTRWLTTRHVSAEHIEAFTLKQYFLLQTGKRNFAGPTVIFPRLDNRQTCLTLATIQQKMPSNSTSSGQGTKTASGVRVTSQPLTLILLLTTDGICRMVSLSQSYTPKSQLQLNSAILLMCTAQIMTANSQISVTSSLTTFTAPSFLSAMETVRMLTF
jgi:hypothetical protein